MSCPWGWGRTLGLGLGFGLLRETGVAHCLWLRLIVCDLFGIFGVFLTSISLWENSRLRRQIRRKLSNNDAQLSIVDTCFLSDSNHFCKGFSKCDFLKFWKVPCLGNRQICMFSHKLCRQTWFLKHTPVYGSIWEVCGWKYGSLHSWAGTLPYMLYTSRCGFCFSAQRCPIFFLLNQTAVSIWFEWMFWMAWYAQPLRHAF